MSAYKTMISRSFRSPKGARLHILKSVLLQGGSLLFTPLLNGDEVTILASVIQL